KALFAIGFPPQAPASARSGGSDLASSRALEPRHDLIAVIVAACRHACTTVAQLATGIVAAHAQPPSAASAATAGAPAGAGRLRAHGAAGKPIAPAGLPSAMRRLVAGVATATTASPGSTSPAARGGRGHRATTFATIDARPSPYA